MSEAITRTHSSSLSLGLLRSSAGRRVMRRVRDVSGGGRLLSELLRRRSTFRHHNRTDTLSSASDRLRREHECSCAARNRAVAHRPLAVPLFVLGVLPENAVTLSRAKRFQPFGDAFPPSVVLHSALS